MATYTATTVLDWSNGQSELKLNSVGPYISNLRTLLEQAGIDMTKYATEDDNVFDYTTEEAVKEFQRTSMGITPTGIVDDATINALIASANNMSDIIYAQNAETTSEDSSSDGDPHFDSFFASGKSKVTRRNNSNIKIVLGDNSVTKIIHNVYMRSVSTEFDTSGNPISEIYEFIAQDLTESDEDTDSGKY